MRKIDAVIWDMDGVLIDSEPFWQQAEVKAFAQVGLHIPHDQLTATMGLRIDAAVQYWFDRHPWPTPPLTTDVALQITNYVIELIGEQGVAKEGVLDTLNFFKAKGMRMAIASSSYLDLMQAVVKHLDIADYFEFLHSAELEAFGKPHPAVYITTAQKLGVLPANCLVIEDSLRGILAAKAAEMHCLAVPDPIIRGDARLSIADATLQSLSEFDASFWEQFAVE